MSHKFGSLPGSQVVLGVEAVYANGAARSTKLTYRAVE